MTVLLDVNVLVSLAWPNHVQHAAAHRWFGALAGETWATCPLTQSGFVRVSSNRQVIPEARTPREAIEVLGRIAAQPGHVFWEDDVALATSPFVARDRLMGYRQITDAHLLALTLSRGGRLATFDRGIVSLVPEGVDVDTAIELLQRSPA